MKCADVMFGGLSPKWNFFPFFLQYDSNNRRCGDSRVGTERHVRINRKLSASRLPILCRIIHGAPNIVSRTEEVDSSNVQSRTVPVGTVSQ